VHPPAITAFSHELDHRILHEVAAGRGVSQRSLARDLGVALGLTNLLLRRLARKGLIEIVKIKPNRVRYVITPAGVAEKARMTRAYLDYSVRFYAEARERLLDSFAALSADWPATDGAEKTIVFYGAGEVAEIGYVCLQESDLKLVGVVDDERRRPFFGLPVHASHQLGPDRLGDIPYGRVVVMSLRDPEAMRTHLERMGCASHRIYTL
jgi:DNA-binding MarR family transcriptional regulator